MIYPNQTRMLVRYIINIPTAIPDATAALERFLSPSSRIHLNIVIITWNIAPAPIERNTTVANGE